MVSQLSIPPDWFLSCAWELARHCEAKYERSH
jgi:hypothetical protein